MRKKRWINIVALLMALAVFVTMASGFAPTKANAASSSEIKKQIEALKDQKKANDAEIKELKAQLKETNNELKKINERKSNIDQEIALNYAQIDLINEQIAAYSLLIADKQAELDVAEAHLSELNAKYKERIRAMEEGGTLSYWSVLFKANSFSDLLDRLSMIEEIAEADSRRLKELRHAAAVVEAAKEELEVERQEQQDAKAELKSAQDELEEMRAEADALMQEQLAKGEEFQLYLEEAEDKSADFLKEIAKQEKEYKNALYKEWLATSVPPTTKKPSSSSGTTGNVGGSGKAGAPRTVNGITWLVPVNYTKFTSPYGWRIHPVYGYRKFHYGVDLAAPVNTPIIATRSGTVTAASRDSSLGYYVTINHGDGFSSIYSHMTRYIVKPGDIVSAGQVIGYVGATGVATGYHLDFKITYNGSYVNPADYIKI